MIDRYWFKDRVDAELGETPGSAADRLQAVTARVSPPTRRRIAELSAASSVVLVTLAVILLTVALGPGRAILGGSFPDPPPDPSTVDSRLPNLPPVTAPAGLPNLPATGGPGGPVATSDLGGDATGGPGLSGTPLATVPGSGTATTPPAGGGPTATPRPGTTTTPPHTTTPAPTTTPPPTTTDPPPTPTDPPTTTDPPVVP